MRLMFTLLLASLATTWSFAQNFNGKKMLTVGLGFQATSTTIQSNSPVVVPREQTTSSTTFSTELLYGKVNSRGRLFAYGLLYRFAKTRSHSDTARVVNNRETLLYPQIMFQKFLPVTTRFFFAPAAKFRVRYDRDHTEFSKYNLYEAEVAITPLSFAVGLKPRTNVLFAVGELNLHYGHTRYRSLNPLQSYSSRTNTIDLSGTFQNVQVAVQFLL